MTFKEKLKINEEMYRSAKKRNKSLKSKVSTRNNIKNIFSYTYIINVNQLNTSSFNSQSLQT